MNLTLITITTLSVLLANQVNPPMHYVAPEPIVIQAELPVVKSKVETAPIDPIKSLFIQKGQEYGVSWEDMYKTAKCENSSFNPTLQSYFYKNGKRERSFGIVQINLPAHPEVSYEEATSVEFSVDFMAKEFSKGNQKIWSCWNIIHK